jgi:hypothetical protein
MKPVESVAAYEEVVESAGGSLPEISTRMGFECMLSFYATVEAEGCVHQSGDMLLFEWGTYNWGEGECFELSISRQFMELGEEGEPQISQLRLVFKYPANSSLTALAEGNRWCGSRPEIVEFQNFLQTHPPYLSLANTDAPSVRLSHTFA